MTFIYFHGFNSKPNPSSEKIKHLEELGEVRFISYNTFDTFANINEHITSKLIPMLEELGSENVTLVGTSLGGYWAGIMSSVQGVPAILINPSINPSESMKRYVGIEMSNYQTNEKNTLEAHVPESYKRLPRIGMYLILIDDGDEVFDTLPIKKHFYVNRVISFPGGSHRFEHMKESLPFIQTFINDLQTIHF